MLSKCRITNFKSIVDKPLEFAPLTIFCGTNSSGKSTVLQSILLMKQNLRINTDLPQIALNGDIVKLGTISEVKSVFSKNGEDISLEYEIEQEKETVKFGIGIAAGGSEKNPIPTQITIENQDGKISFCFDKGILHNCQIELLVKGKSIKFTTDYNTDDFKKHFPGYILMSYYDFLSCYLFEDINMVKNIVDIDANVEINLNSNFFFQKELVEQYGPFDPNDPNRTKNLINNIITGEIGPIVKKCLGRYLEKDMDMYADNPVFLVRELLKENPDIRNNLIKDRTRIEKELYQINILEALIVPFSSSFKNNAIDIIHDFFHKNLFYLGPLRAEPSSHDYGSGILDGVGFKGEHTAAYYANNHEKCVMRISEMFYDGDLNLTVDDIPIYRNMPQILKYLTKTSYKELLNLKYQNITSYEEFLEVCRRDTAPFLSAELSFWLQYIEVADSIEVENNGPMESYIKVIQGEGKNRVESLLNNVGVGVSQILPILIQCLAADRGSTILIEQPELHLHPKMQTRLADFFLAMSLIGKQIIIETHSEYIVDRLRLRIVQAPLAHPLCGKNEDQIAIYFVEKNDKGSQFTKIKINEFAVMSEWPEGFFEESSQLAEEIFFAARKKYLENPARKQEDNDELDVEDNDD